MTMEHRLPGEVAPASLLLLEPIVPLNFFTEVFSITYAGASLAWEKSLQGIPLTR